MGLFGFGKKKEKTNEETKEEKALKLLNEYKRTLSAALSDIKFNAKKIFVEEHVKVYIQAINFMLEGIRDMEKPKKRQQGLVKLNKGLYQLEVALNEGAVKDPKKIKIVETQVRTMTEAFKRI